MIYLINATNCINKKIDEATEITQLPIFNVYLLNRLQISQRWKSICHNGVSAPFVTNSIFHAPKFVQVILITATNCCIIAFQNLVNFIIYSRLQIVRYRRVYFRLVKRQPRALSHASLPPLSPTICRDMSPTFAIVVHAAFSYTLRSWSTNAPRVQNCLSLCRVRLTRRRVAWNKKGISSNKRRKKSGAA